MLKKCTKDARGRIGSITLDILHDATRLDTLAAWLAGVNVDDRLLDGYARTMDAMADRIMAKGAALKELLRGGVE